MSSAIDFWFDFSSPYGYLAAERVDAVGARHGRDVRWHAILLGPLFKVVGTAPLTTLPVKGDYSAHDFARTARLLGIPFTLPSHFPVATQVAARAFYLVQDESADKAKQFARLAYRAYFAEGEDITDASVVMTLAAQAGADTLTLEANLGGEAIKQRVRGEVEAALEAGVFGSPFFKVDGEPFWGNDRLPHLEEWLRRGGW